MSARHATPSSSARMLVLDEILTTVKHAKEGNQLLMVGAQAGRIAQTHPGSGLTPQHIADDLIRAAVRAGVAVEMRRPELGG